MQYDAFVTPGMRSAPGWRTSFDACDVCQVQQDRHLKVSVKQPAPPGSLLPLRHRLASPLSWHPQATVISWTKPCAVPPSISSTQNQSTSSLSEPPNESAEGAVHYSIAVLANRIISQVQTHE